MRRGFTLIEVVLALILFQFGMLALAASAAVAARDLSVANRRLKARSLAEARVARLRASRCPAPGAGSLRVAGGFVEHWTVTDAGGIRRVVDSVAMTLPRGREASVVVRAWVLCA